MNLSIMAKYISKEQREELIKEFGREILKKNIVDVNIVRLNEDNYENVKSDLQKIFGNSLVKFPKKEELLRLRIAGLFAGTVLYLNNKPVDGVIYDPEGEYISNKDILTYYNGDYLYIANQIYGNYVELFARNVRLSQISYFD